MPNAAVTYAELATAASINMGLPNAAVWNAELAKAAAVTKAGLSNALPLRALSSQILP